MAIANGLTTAIANPLDKELMGLTRASDVLLSKDLNSSKYINYYSEYELGMTAPSVSVSGTGECKFDDKLYQSILRGNAGNIKGLIIESLERREDPGEILNKRLLPAITEAGNLFESKAYFLPQLMLAAEAMKTAFSILEPYLKKDEMGIRGKVVFATVRGDVHDIGKNIVILLLKNYGFEVTDLGKDVPNEVVLEKADQTGADIIALSALMTTTMQRMREFMDLMKERGSSYNVLVGGAAVTREFAESIGAYYSADAVSAVKTSIKIIGL
jgi:5-methyltetrahydrofolate--homocysteine methyltransferase